MKNRFKIFGVIISLFLIITVVGCDKKDKNNVEKDYNEIEYNLETVSGTIYGTLILPEKIEKPTVALIIAGSGPTDRDGNTPVIPGKNDSLKMIAEALADEGIASVRFDKRGIAESAALIEKEEDLVFDDYIDDVISWVNKLKEDDRFSRIVVIGHSEGALIGAVASYKSNVDAFVSVAGLGNSAYDTLIRQLKEQSEDIYNRSLPILEELKAGNLVKDVDEDLYSLFRPSVQPYLKSWFKYEPVEEIKKIKVPVLIIQGQNDIQVTVEDAKLLYEGSVNGELVIIDDMNHILKNAPKDRNKNIATYSNPDLPLNKEFVRELVGFINRIN